MTTAERVAFARRIAELERQAANAHEAWATLRRAFDQQRAAIAAFETALDRAGITRAPDGAVVNRARTEADRFKAALDVIAWRLAGDPDAPLSSIRDLIGEAQKP